MRPNTLTAYAAGIITGGLLTAATVFLAGPARADNTVYQVAVCGTLDDYPSISGIVGIGSALMDEGYSGESAGRIVAESVMAACPEYLPLLKRFVAIYGTPGKGAA